MRTHIQLLGAAAAIVLVTGCANMDDTQRRTATGAGIGALAGAVIGSATGGSAGTGAVVGAGVGARCCVFSCWASQSSSSRLAAAAGPGYSCRQAVAG